MATNLQASLIFRFIDRMTSPMRRVTNNFNAMSKASVRAGRAFNTAANIRQAAEGMNRFSRAARGVVAAPIKAFMDFEAAMSGVRAVTGDILPAQFTELTAKAKELGATTRFTAVQAAEGFKFFGIAGWNAAEQIEALPAAMDLSVASGTDLGRTADILSDIMGAFNKEAYDATIVSDQLAYTLTNSNTTMETLFETMKLAGPIATTLKIPLSDVAAMSGLMGSAGIKGSMAGTALRSSMLKLAAPSSRARDMLKSVGIAIDDGSGNMRSMVDILGEVADKTKDMGTRKVVTFVKELTGLRAVSGITKLMAEGGDRIREFSSEIAGAGGRAKEMARIMDDNLKGELVLLTSAFNGLMIVVGEQLTPIVRSLTTFITKLVHRLTLWTLEHPRLTRAIFITVGVVAVLATVLTGLLFTAAAVASTIGVLAFAMGGTTTASLLLKAGMSGIGPKLIGMIPAIMAYTASWWSAAAGVIAATWPVILIIAVLAVLGAAIYIAIFRWEEFTGILDRFQSASTGTKVVLGGMFGQFAGLIMVVRAIGDMFTIVSVEIRMFFLDLGLWAEEAARTIKKWLGPYAHYFENWIEGPLRSVISTISETKDAIAQIPKESAYVLTGKEEYKPQMTIAEAVAQFANTGKQESRLKVEVVAASGTSARVVEEESDGFMDMIIDKGMSMVGEF